MNHSIFYNKYINRTRRRFACPRDSKVARKICKDIYYKSLLLIDLSFFFVVRNVQHNLTRGLCGWIFPNYLSYILLSWHSCRLSTCVSLSIDLREHCECSTSNALRMCRVVQQHTIYLRLGDGERHKCPR